MPDRWWFSKYFRQSVTAEAEQAKPLSRKERRKKGTQQKPTKNESPSSIGVSLVAVASWLTYVLGVVASLAALIAFFPEFSVSREVPLDPANPLTALFVVRYETIVPVANVNVSCYINEITGPTNNGIANVNIKATRIRVGNMWQGDEITVPCVPPGAFNVVGGVVHGDVTLRILFRPIIWPRFSERDFRFVTATQADGHLRWFPETKSFQSN
jgi:hypothetical protein